MSNYQVKHPADNADEPDGKLILGGNVIDILDKLKELIGDKEVTMYVRWKILE